MSVPVEGFVEPGFQSVRDAFVRNLTERGDIGAAVCVYRWGRPVVDLAGGVTDPDTAMPYRRDTLQPVFSTTKGVVAVAANILADRGRLDLDAPVADYWPEFARNGKGGIPVRWLLTHQAGLAVIDGPLTLDEFLSWDPVIDRLAEQAPNWEPGTRHGYHSLTYGFLVGELVRRITGLTVGAWLAQEVAIPLCAEFFIGLPSRLDGRIARVLPFPNENGGLAKFTEPGADSLPYRPVGFVQPPLVPELVNQPRVRRAQLPSFNGIGTAKAPARIWASLIGEVDGVRLLSAPAMEAARAEQVRGPDLIDWDFTETALCLGFRLPTDAFPFAGPGSFGASGLGGSRAWALPEQGLAFGYVLNQPQSRYPDQREVALSRAVLACCLE